MLWPGKTHSGFSRLFKLIVCFVILLCAFGVLSSGSRKSLLVFAFVIIAWVWLPLAPRSSRGSCLWRVSIVISILIFGGSLGAYIMENTLAGERMSKRLDASNNVAEAEEKRVTLYLEGLEMTAGNPLCGVGMNQFKVLSSTGMYSHSNYMEPLATTGIIGFLLYQGIFFMPLIRARRVILICNSLEIKYKLRIIIIGSVAILLLGLGAPFNNSTTVLPILALFSAYTFRLEKRVR